MKKENEENLRKPSRAQRKLIKKLAKKAAKDAMKKMDNNLYNVFKANYNVTVKITDESGVT